MSQTSTAAQPLSVSTILVSSPSQGEATCVSENLPAVPPELRRELVDYYKWVVNLSTFVLTVSLTLSTVLGPPRFRWLLLAGWILLAVCIFFDWMLIKSLLSVAAAAASPQDTWTALHYTMLRGVGPRQKAYGLIQNAAFLLGVLCVVLGYALSL